MMLSNPMTNFGEEQRLQRSLPITDEGKCFVQCHGTQHLSETVKGHCYIKQIVLFQKISIVTPPTKGIGNSWGVGVFKVKNNVNE